MIKYSLVIDNGVRTFKVKQGKKPWKTFNDGDPMPEKYKDVFERMAADLEAPGTKETFEQLEKELNLL